MNQFDKLKAKLQADAEAAQAIAAEFGNPDKVKAALMAFAHTQGIAITAAELEAGIAAQTAPQSGVLGEAELDQVAGGLATSIVVSIFSFGIGCAIISAAVPSAPGETRKCGEILRDL